MRNSVDDEIRLKLRDVSYFMAALLDCRQVLVQTTPLGLLMRSAAPLAAVIGLFAGAGCTSPSAAPTPGPARATAAMIALTPAPGVRGNPDSGRALILASGCSGCHTVPGVDGANGVIGPRLNNVVLRPTLAGETIPNSEDTLTRWLLDPPSLKPGTTMPRLGLTEQEAQDITAFFYSQPVNPIP